MPTSIYRLSALDPPCPSAGSTLLLPMQVFMLVVALRELLDLQHTRQLRLLIHRAPMIAVWQCGAWTLTVYSTQPSVHSRTRSASIERLRMSQGPQGHTTVSLDDILAITYSTIIVSQSTIDYTPRMEQFHPPTKFIPMTLIWDVS